MNQILNTPNKANILMVDDTPDNLRLLVTLLGNNGYRVRPVTSGKLALEAIAAQPPDLILLDILMPELDGYQVCEILKSDPRYKQIPIIFLSALNEGIDKAKAFQVGGADYITKPLQMEEVIARVENQLKLQLLQAELQQKNQALTAQNDVLQEQIEARRRGELEIRLLLAATQAISKAADFNSAINSILFLICQAIGWDFGEAWIPSKDEKNLIYFPSLQSSNSEFERYKKVSSSLIFLPGEGLAGRIWLSQQPEWIEDLSISSPSLFSRVQSAATVGLKTAFGVPILAKDNVLAVLIFYQKKISPNQSRLVELVKAVATQLGGFIARKQAEEALKIAEQRYHSIVENAIAGIFQSTPDGHYLSVNPALAKIYGYDSPTELIVSMTDIGGKLYVDPNRRREFIATMEANQAISGFESQVYRKDGSKIWITENVRAVRDESGKLLYYEGTVSDITALKLEQAQTKRLLLSILPQPIALRLQQGESPIADHFESVSVLFADLVGFTEVSSRKTPAELVKILNQIFSSFDRLAQAYKLEKIKTIGDAYMVVGGLPTACEDRTTAIAHMALDMQAAIAQFNAQVGETLELRIGINLGAVIAGVIGVSKFIYDLWGDTVNIASRMESSGLPGKIQVTAAVYDQLKQQFILEKRGAIAVKGKGEMLTYWLISKR
jgi:adenylate cyclase